MRFFFRLQPMFMESGRLDSAVLVLGRSGVKMALQWGQNKFPACGWTSSIWQKTAAITLPWASVTGKELLAQGGASTQSQTVWPVSISWQFDQFSQLGTLNGGWPALSGNLEFQLPWRFCSVLLGEVQWGPFCFACISCPGVLPENTKFCTYLVGVPESLGVFVACSYRSVDLKHLADKNTSAKKDFVHLQNKDQMADHVLRIVVVMFFLAYIGQGESKSFYILRRCTPANQEFFSSPNFI